MSYRNIRIERDEEWARLVLDRDGGNLLNIDVMEEMNDALLELRGQPGLEVLVLCGSGETFCEGLDLAEHRRERLQRLLQVYSRIFETIRMIDMVTVAAVNGKAWGSGFELALGCNLIVATDDASFRLPEIERGIIPHIAAIILPRVVPRRRAMEWILTGNEIAAAELHGFGLINRLFPAATFEDGLTGFVRELTAKSGPVLQLAKRSQYEAYYSTYEEALYRVQNIYMRELMELEDASEGIRAHLEGRKPAWKNR
ncbi:MAG TPA: enoyl-CoA hydratase/isomerase family protein [Longimicrobiales bacterium]|nr:enoyl-CoA hydratase/isomerase family protein [Longimicrobiales bacterium]